MPKINLPKRIREPRKHSSKKDNEIHRLVYNTSDWRKLRLRKLLKNPLCERCYQKGLIVSGIEIHHITPISEGKSPLEKLRLGFKFDNLVTLCRECHKQEHSI